MQHIFMVFAVLCSLLLCSCNSYSPPFTQEKSTDNEAVKEVSEYVYIEDTEVPINIIEEDGKETNSSAATVPDHYVDYTNIPISTTSFTSFGKFDSFLLSHFDTITKNLPEYLESEEFKTVWELLQLYSVSGDMTINELKASIKDICKRQILKYLTSKGWSEEDAIYYIASHEHISYSQQEYLAKIQDYMKKFAVTTENEVYEHIPEVKVHFEVLKDKVLDYLLTHSVTITKED